MSVSGLFNAYRPLQAGETCLAPIIDFFQAAYSIQPSKELIFGLLEELHEKQLIRSVNQLQLEGFLIHGNETTLAFYTPEIVRQRIENLLEKKKSQTD